MAVVAAAGFVMALVACGADTTSQTDSEEVREVEQAHSVGVGECCNGFGCPGAPHSCNNIGIWCCPQSFSLAICRNVLTDVHNCGGCGCICLGEQSTCVSGQCSGGSTCD